MEIIYTKEQEDIIEVAMQPEKYPSVAVMARAGCSKSSTIQEYARRKVKQDPSYKILYLVFGAAAYEEAKTEFGHTAQCYNLHKLAYHYTVKPFKLSTNIKSFITWKDIPSNIKQPWGKTTEALVIMGEYLTSGHTNLDSFIQERNKKTHIDVQYSIVHFIDQVINAMASGKMPITHDFYLKLFHIMVLTGGIKLPPVGTIAADEIQDFSVIAKDIFLSYPAIQRISIGDRAQSIFGWMGCINLFDLLPETTKFLPLTKTFRVDRRIAKVVELMARHSFEPKMVFEGMDYPANPTIKTKAYLTRTNSSLISKMIELDDKDIPFRLSTKAKVSQMFSLPLGIIAMKQGDTQINDELKHIQDDVDAWAMIPNGPNKKGKLSYIMQENKDNPSIISACKLIMKHTPDRLIQAKKAVDKHKKSNANLICMTAHTSKGMSIDTVELDDDMDESMAEAVVDLMEVGYVEEKFREAWYLYYVAVTRARHKVTNAKLLNKYAVGMDDTYALLGI